MAFSTVTVALTAAGDRQSTGAPPPADRALGKLTRDLPAAPLAARGPAGRATPKR